MHENRDYYEDRAEAELACAQQSEDPAAVKAHYALASYYLDLAYGDGTVDALISGATADVPPPIRLPLLAQLRAIGIIVFGENPT